MGYLPIILSLLGFLFLWAAVNYNSLRTKKAEARQAAEEVFRFAGMRNNLLKQMSRVADGDKSLQKLLESILPHLNEKSFGNISLHEKLEDERFVTTRIQDLPEHLGETPDYANTYRQLMTVSSSYQKAASVYLKRLREYNELVRRNPSRLIAGLFGFKSIKSM